MKKTNHEKNYQKFHSEIVWNTTPKSKYKTKIQKKKAKHNENKEWENIQKDTITSQEFKDWLKTLTTGLHSRKYLKSLFQDLKPNSRTCAGFPEIQRHYLLSYWQKGAFCTKSMKT